MSSEAESGSAVDGVTEDRPDAWSDRIRAAEASSLADVSTRNLLEVVCNNATVALFIMDERQHCVYMNPAAEALTGFRLTEVRGQPLHNLIHHTRPDGSHYPLSDCPIDRALPHNNQEQGEEVFVHRDGHFYPVSFTASPIRDATGKPIGTVIEVQDITERTRREQALRASEAYLRTAIDASAGGFYGIDRDGVTTICNQAFLQMLGFKRMEDVIGRVLHDVIHHTRPDGAPYAKEDCPIYRAARTGQPAHVQEELLFRVDGSSFPVEYWTLPILREGVICGAVTTFIDISERKAAEQALRDARLRLDGALTAAEIGIFVWDVVTDRLYGDPNFDRIFGVELDPDGAAPLARFVAVLHPEDRDRVMARVQETVDTGRDYEAEYRIVSRGRERWVLARGKAERDASGKTVSFPGVLVDVTDRKKVEAARRELEHRFLQQSRLLEGIAAATPDFIYVFDRKGRVLYANRRQLEAWGLSFKDAVGKNLYEIGLPEWHADMHMREFAEILETKKPVAGEFAFTGGSGISGIYEYIFSPVLGPDGEVEVITGTTRDITLRKQVEEASRQGKEVLEIALAASETGTFRFDLASGRFLDFDPNLKRLFGFAPDAPVLTSADFLSKVHPDDRPTVAPALERTTRAGVDFEMEFRVVHADGSVHWLLDRAKVMHDADGRPSYLVGACTDITRRRKSEELARAAADRFRFMAETMPQKIFTAAPDGDIDYFNGQWVVFTGLAMESILHWGWTQFVHPDDVEENLRLWRQAVATGEPFQIEHRFRRHDGVYRWHLTRAEAMRDSEGRIMMWIGSNTDIDDVKRSEERLREIAERLRAALDAAKTGTFRWDLRSNALSWDENLNRLFALPPGETVQRLDQFMERVHPDDQDALMERIRRCTEDGADFEMELRILWPDGSVRWLDDKGKMTLDEQGRPLYMTGACVDITERKRADEERQSLLEAERRARAEAESVSRLKDEFLATLSHELRTPLTAILGWSQLLLRHHHHQGEIGDGLSVIERNARVQVQLVEDLLDMSRIVSGKLRLDVQRVDVAPIIRAAVDSVMPAAEAKGIRIQTVLDTHVSPVRGDAARLQQVIWNLLSNAIKFTPKGGRVQVALERVNSHIEITVTDTGVGIAPEFLPYVFERFRQADGAANRKHGGLGLGLAIVKSLVEMHGGLVRAKSPGVGQGATFSVELPIMVVHEDDAPGDKQHPRLPAWDESADFCGDRMLEGLSILVVDDEKDARDLVRRVLEDCQGTVTVAADAEEAMDMLRRLRPDVLLSDIGMPGEDGYSLIRRIRSLPVAEGGDTPAVALTAFARSEDRRRALLAGFQAHVAKPVEPAELVTVVASVAGKMRARRS